MLIRPSSRRECAQKYARYRRGGEEEMRKHISLQLLQLAGPPGQWVGFIGGVNFADVNSLSALGELYAAEPCSSNV